MADEQVTPAKTLDIVCNFIGDFEVADNMVRNGQALCALMGAGRAKFPYPCSPVRRLTMEVLEASLSVIEGRTFVHGPVRRVRSRHTTCDDVMLRKPHKNC